MLRTSKTTKEIAASELEQLTKPEARETAAFDARELQGLLDQSRTEDDLAIPLAHAVSSNVVSMPRASAFAVPSNTVLAAASGEVPLAAASGEVPVSPDASRRTSPGFIAPRASTSPGAASSRASTSPGAASSRASTSPGAASSTLIPMTTEFGDEPGHDSTAEIPVTASVAATSLPSSATRVARGSAGTPKAHRPLTKPSETQRGSLLPWIIVALAAAVVIALAMWR